MTGQAFAHLMFGRSKTQNSFCQKHSVWGILSLSRNLLLIQSFTSSSSSNPNSHGKMLKESFPPYSLTLFNCSLESFHTIHHTSPVKPPFQTKLGSCNSPRREKSSTFVPTEHFGSLLSLKYSSSFDLQPARLNASVWGGERRSWRQPGTW